MDTQKNLVQLGNEWFNAKVDILGNKRSGGDERLFVITGSHNQAQRFATMLTHYSEQAYKWFNCTYEEMNSLCLDYKLYRDGVMNGEENPRQYLRRWELVYPGAFANLYETQSVDIMDSVDEILVNILSGVLQTRRIILGKW